MSGRRWPGVTLTLEPGRTLAVFGANGAGKTTLLRILATLLRPHAGRVRVLGARPAAPTAGRCAGGSGCWRTTRCSTASCPRARTCASTRGCTGSAEARVEALLDQVGLRARADEPVRTLSRGMAQRVAICRTALHEPELLLLDEPLANLDPGAADAVEPLIGRAAGPARVLISHDVEHGLEEADLVLGLKAGRPVLLEPAGSVTAADVRGLY